MLHYIARTETPRKNLKLTMDEEDGRGGTQKHKAQLHPDVHNGDRVVAEARGDFCAGSVPADLEDSALAPVRLDQAPILDRPYVQALIEGSAGQVLAVGRECY